MRIRIKIKARNRSLKELKMRAGVALSAYRVSVVPNRKRYVRNKQIIREQIDL